MFPFVEVNVIDKLSRPLPSWVVNVKNETTRFTKYFTIHTNGMYSLGYDLKLLGFKFLSKEILKWILEKVFEVRLEFDCSGPIT